VALSEVTLEEIVLMLVDGRSKALDEMMYVKDFLMNLTTRENWNENAKACLDQIRDLLNHIRNPRRIKVKSTESTWNICSVLFFGTRDRVLRRMNFGTIQYMTFQSGLKQKYPNLAGAMIRTGRKCLKYCLKNAFWNFFSGAGRMRFLNAAMGG
jgi:hypothetical protein